MSSPTVDVRPRFLSSPLHDVFRTVNRLVAESTGDVPEICRLDVGEPGFAIPRGVPDAIRAAFFNGTAGYCDAQGLASFRASLVDKISTENHINATVERISVTPGSTQGLYSILTVLCRPGEEVLLPVPHWPVYAQQCAALGLTARYYSAPADGAIDLERLRAAITPAVRAIIVNSPGNPSGAVIPGIVLRGVLEVAAEKGVAVISDEAYEDFVFQGSHCSSASVEASTDVGAQVWTTFSFSKSFALTGLRVGYVVAPSSEAAELFAHVQEASLVCPSSPAQAAGQAALAERPAAVAAARAHLLINRAAALPPLLRAGLLECEPAGGWYAMCHVPDRFVSAEAYADWALKEHRVAVAPGTSFGPPGNARLPAPASDSQSRRFRVALCGAPEAVTKGAGLLSATSC